MLDGDSLGVPLQLQPGLLVGVIGGRVEVHAAVLAGATGPRQKAAPCGRAQTLEIPLGIEVRCAMARGYPPAAMADTLKIIVLEGDETGQELLEQAVRVLDADVLGIELELANYDLSLEKRRETDNEIVHEAARAMREAGFGLKAATITPEGKDDVGSPNRILREEVDGKVIVRTGRRIPGRGRAGVRRLSPDLRGPDGRRRRLRRQAVARGRRRRGARVPDREGVARRPAARSPSTRS